MIRYYKHHLSFDGSMVNGKCSAGTLSHGRAIAKVMLVTVVFMCVRFGSLRREQVQIWFSEDPSVEVIFKV